MRCTGSFKAFARACTGCVWIFGLRAMKSRSGRSFSHAPLQLFLVRKSRCAWATHSRDSSAFKRCPRPAFSESVAVSVYACTNIRLPHVRTHACVHRDTRHTAVCVGRGSPPTRRHLSCPHPAFLVCTYIRMQAGTQVCTHRQLRGTLQADEGTIWDDMVQEAVLQP